MKRRLTRKTRIGLLGGTFDPIHLGHINLAQRICDFGLIEQLIFVPAGIPPHKLGAPITCVHHREAMLSLALKGYDNFHISDFEIKRKAISYSITTVNYFSRYFNQNLYLIIGMDSLSDLHTWYEAKKLVNQCKFLIYERPGYLIPNKTDIRARFGKIKAEKLYNSIVPGIVTDVSSSAVRSLIREDRDVSKYVSPGTLRYINENGLYRC